MDNEPRPSSRRLGKAAVVVVGLVIAMAVITFVGMNIWHAQDLATEQAEDGNRATEHTPPNFVESNEREPDEPGVPADITKSDITQSEQQP